MAVLIFLTWLFIGLTAYVYVGYPLLIWFLSKIIARPVDKADIEPNLTMIIPTFNEEDVIRRKVENTLALNYPREKLEVLVIDDDSDDATVKIISEYPDVTLIRKPERRGKMSSLEIGFEKASGDIVIMSDASPNYEKDSLRKLVQSFNDPGVGVTVGKLAVWDAENAVARPASAYWQYEAAIRKWESALGSTIGMHGNMYAIRRYLFQKLDAGTINDEWSITMRVFQQGYRAIYEPEAVSYDDVSKEMKDEFKRRIRINAGRYQAFFSSQNLIPWNNKLVLFEIFSHKFLRLMLPFFMIGALLSNAFLLLLDDNPRVLMVLLFISQLFFYGLAFIGYLAEKSLIPKNKIANIAYFLTSSNIASFFGFLRYLRGRQSVKWDKAKLDIQDNLTTTGEPTSLD